MVPNGTGASECLKLVWFCLRSFVEFHVLFFVLELRTKLSAMKFQAEKQHNFCAVMPLAKESFSTCRKATLCGRTSCYDHFKELYVIEVY